MDFLGVGPGELILILIIALIVFGPQRLPELGATVGKALREFRQMSQELTQDFSELTQDVSKELQTVSEAVSEATTEIKEADGERKDAADKSEAAR